MTTDEKIAVLQAFKEGKTIQYTVRGCGLWYDTTSPCWDFNHYDYRIKPEEPKPKYRPYKREELWEELRCKRDNWLTKKSNGNSVIIREFDDDFIWIGNLEIGSRYDLIMQIYTWPDGTPFGVKEE